MARFVVEGGTPLRGEITPAGNKNEALPLIAASLLTDEPVTLHNVPRIRDVRGMLEVVSALGAKVEELDERTVRITGELKTMDVPSALAREIRTSLLFAGPLLARYKKVKLGLPGGDVLGRRRNDTHFLALRAFGAELDVSSGGYGLHTSGLKGADVLLDEPSVTATENALMAAVLAPGRTVIRNAASEPHVQQLGIALMKMGARMVGIGTNTITIDGAERLTGIETAVATQAEGTVLIHEWMYPGRMYWVGSLESMGARIVLCDPHRVVVVGPSQLYGSDLRSPDIRAGMALLAATLSAKGTSTINNVEQIDRGYEELDKRLRALGAKIERAA